jgi:hypothetical protein
VPALIPVAGTYNPGPIEPPPLLRAGRIGLINQGYVRSERELKEKRGILTFSQLVPRLVDLGAGWADILHLAR